MKLLHLTGQTFGILTVISRAPNKMNGRHVAWHCSCKCGGHISTTTAHLRSGHTTSCGCIRRSILGQRSITHGHTIGRKIPSEYLAWCAMKSRCSNPNDHNYVRYGARGITVHPSWQNDFSAFFAEMGVRPPGHSLDRINNEGNYEPGNCRWATDIQQANNTRRNIYVSHNGTTMTLKQVAQNEEVKYQYLWRVHVDAGIPLDRAITEVREGRSR